MNIKKQLDSRGWVICKNIFSKQEIDTFRDYALHSKDWNQDLLSHRELRNVLLDQKIISLVKKALQTDNPVYFGDSTVSINTKGIGQHKDSVDRNYAKGKDWSEDYSLIRVGVYLQNNKSSAGGLSLRDKSHLTTSLNKGKLINVQNEIGDVILWKLTTTHSPNANSFRFSPQVPAHPMLIRFLPSFFFRNVPTPRIAYFMTFGKNDYHLNKYIEYLKTRSYMVKNWRNIEYPQEALENAENAGIEVRKIEGLDKIEDVDLNVNFKQMYFD